MFIFFSDVTPTSKFCIQTLAQLRADPRGVPHHTQLTIDNAHKRLVRATNLVGNGLQAAFALTKPSKRLFQFKVSCHAVPTYTKRCSNFIEKQANYLAD